MVERLRAIDRRSTASELGLSLACTISMSSSVTTRTSVSSVPLSWRIGLREPPPQEHPAQQGRDIALLERPRVDPFETCRRVSAGVEIVPHFDDEGPRIVGRVTPPKPR